MVYLVCPECLTTNTLKKSESPAAVCVDCSFEVGKYFYNERSPEELEAFINEENSSLKKLRNKKAREHRKHQQSVSNQSAPSSIQRDTYIKGDYFWTRVYYNTNRFCFFLLSLILISIILKFIFPDFVHGIINILSENIDRFIYIPIFGGLFESMISIDDGRFYDLRYFLLETARGGLVLTLSFTYSIAYLLHTFSYFRAYMKSSGSKLGSPIELALVFTLAVTLMSPSGDLNEFDQFYLWLLALIGLGVFKLTNKIIG